jgi:formylglycine-generating enzyme required for sulfatase activity
MKVAVINYMKLVSLLIVIGCAVFVFCAKHPYRHGMAEIKAAGKKFVMGRNGLTNAAPVEITLDHDYYIDRTEVTQAMFQRVMGNNPSFFKGDSTRPVENVSFIDAAEFCNRRSVAEGLSPCFLPATWLCDRTKNGYRLPTEAEWEFACRGGRQTRFSWGNTMNGKYCWYMDNSGKTTHGAGTLRPNRFGLYDMIGNVWEWCDDRFSPDRSQPKYWQLGPKTLRGGSWSSSAQSLESAVRDGGDPQGKSNGVGFRCVRNFEPTSAQK